MTATTALATLPKQRRQRRAALYMRMSTDHQRYSIAQQSHALAGYAIEHDLRIVATYLDEGISGLHLKGRLGLQQLLKDVGARPRKFEILLVYDVSRWGRFQNPDEAAFHEFTCLRAGVEVIYCAEPFSNDGSPMSALVKSMKRVMAGEYSRELSRRVALSHMQLAALGHHQGGPTPFGLRRIIYQKDGQPRATLESGERKAYQGDYVVLGPGPVEEQEAVRHIFRTFTQTPQNETQIAAGLNANRIPTGLDRPWNVWLVRKVLRNEAYLGTVVYNRRSTNLGNYASTNPRSAWVRVENVFEPIVARLDFDRAAARLLARITLPERSLLIEQLQALARTHGFITAPLINRTEGMHKAWVYQRRFGTLLDAYQEAGLTPIRDFDYVNDHRNHARLRNEFVASVSQLYRRWPALVRPFGRSSHLCINEKWILMVRIARMHFVPGPRWVIQAVNPRQADLCLIGRLGPDGETLKDYLLVPTLCLPRRKFHISDDLDLATDLYRFDHLDELCARAEKMLVHDAADMTRTIGRHETRRRFVGKTR
jgi:DNA invertase Pin-like site-specific DNA recombinase